MQLHKWNFLCATFARRHYNVDLNVDLSAAALEICWGQRLLEQEDWKWKPRLRGV